MSDMIIIPFCIRSSTTQSQQKAYHGIMEFYLVLVSPLYRSMLMHEGAKDVYLTPSLRVLDNQNTYQQGCTRRDAVVCAVIREGVPVRHVEM